MAEPIRYAAFLAAILILFSTSCRKEDLKAQKPSYVTVSGINLQTDYPSEGSAHSRITTAWVYANGGFIGAYEIPFTIPVLAEGSTELRMVPGINMNGIGSTRAIYQAFQDIEITTDLTPLDTFDWSASTGGINTAYESRFTIDVIENFDSPGINFERTNRSDTSLDKTSSASDVFVNPIITEPNGKAGKFVLTDTKNFAEFSSISGYSFPLGVQNVYLELTYRCNIPFTVGVIANSLTAITQVPTVVVLESEEWNKIYINLINEIASNGNADNFEIFVGSNKPSTVDTGYVLLDNIKLVY